MIPVTKQSGLAAYWNQLWSNPLVRQYSPGNLLTTAAQSGGNIASPGAVFNPPGAPQVGDPRTNSVGFYYSSVSAGAADLLKGSGGTTNIGGNSITSPVASAFNSGLLIPLAVLAFVLYLLLKK